MSGLKQSIAIYGGSFDPVHFGHMNTAVFIQSQFHFTDFYFLPCKSPVLKPASRASTEARVAMLKLALKPYPDFKVDTREIERDSPSYMIETLESFCKEKPEASLNLIIGYDAFLTLPAWHRWQEILGKANLLVMHREKYQDQVLPAELQLLLKEKRTQNPEDFNSQPNGRIYFLNAGSYKISSSDIRAMIKQKQPVDALLPAEVLTYIRKNALYR